MNAHTKPQKNSVKTAPQSVTTGPIIGSRKIYVAAPEHPEMRVPFREVVLTTDAEPPVRLYDPSGPYTETDARIDLNAGLAQWLIGNGTLPSSYVAAQGTALGRAGRVHVEQVGDTIWVGGATTTTISGRVELG